MNSYLNGKLPQVFGYCDPAFQTVADEFKQNFNDRGDSGDVGASCAVMVEGEMVVDLWGGYADVEKEQVWQEDTLVCCWSVSKGLGAALALMLVDRGRLDINAPVAQYWPGFAANGKEGVLVCHLLNHTAGLSCLDPDLAPGALYDWDTIVTAIEETTPNWEPGSRLGYLNMTHGYLLGELCARVNGGRRLAQALDEELADPLGLDWHFAVPDDTLPRIATVYQADPSFFNSMIEQDPETYFARSMKGRDSEEDYNSLKWRKAQNGSGTSHSNARAMARLYGCLARGGELDGIRILSEDTLNLAKTETVRGICAVNGVEMRFSNGFEMNCPPATPMGSNDRCFGYLGAGGSYAFADPDTKMGFGYSHNFMHMGVGPGPCGLPLVEATIAAVGKA